MTKAGQRILQGLREAIAGDFARVTIEGQTWVRQEPVTTQTDATLTLDEIDEHRRRMNLLLPGADMTLCDRVCAAARKGIERKIDGGTKARAVLTELEGK